MDKAAQRLRMLRREKNLSQQDLAKLIGIGYSTVQGYEQGTNPISSVNLKRIAMFFEVSEAYVRGDTDLRMDSKPNDLETLLKAQEDPNTKGMQLANALEIVDKLEKLVQMYRDGSITEEEYNKIKSKIIG